MDEKPKTLTLNRETIDVLVANVIPTTKYFELRFDTMQAQIDRIEKQNEQLHIDMDNKFGEMRKDVDKRFEQMIHSIDRLSDRLENRDREQRSFTLKMFMISISISVLGVLGVVLKVAGVFG